MNLFKTLIGMGMLGLVAGCGGPLTVNNGTSNADNALLPPGTVSFGAFTVSGLQPQIFSDVLVGVPTPPASCISVLNSGGSPVSGMVPTLTAPFSLQVAASSACGALPLCASSLASGATCGLPVVFAPLMAGAASGSLAIGYQSLNQSLNASFSVVGSAVTTPPTTGGGGGTPGCAIARDPATVYSTAGQNLNFIITGTGTLTLNGVAVANATSVPVAPNAGGTYIVAGTATTTNGIVTNCAYSFVPQTCSLFVTSTSGATVNYSLSFTPGQITNNGASTTLPITAAAIDTNPLAPPFVSPMPFTEIFTVGGQVNVTASVGTTGGDTASCGAIAVPTVTTTPDVACLGTAPASIPPVTTGLDFTGCNLTCAAKTPPPAGWLWSKASIPSSGNIGVLLSAGLVAVAPGVTFTATEETSSTALSCLNQQANFAPTAATPIIGMYTDVGGDGPNDLWVGTNLRTIHTGAGSSETCYNSADGVNSPFAVVANNAIILGWKAHGLGNVGIPDVIFYTAIPLLPGEVVQQFYSNSKTTDSNKWCDAWSIQ